MTVQERTTPSCGPCGEVFAHAAFGGAGLFLAETLRDAALAAGWQQDGEAWTCTVCQAKAAAPVPEPAQAQPTGAHEPPPDTDPIEQSVTILAAYEERVNAFWTDVNRSNNAAHLRIRTRLGDAQIRIGELTEEAA